MSCIVVQWVRCATSKLILEQRVLIIMVPFCLTYDTPYFLPNLFSFLHILWLYGFVGQLVLDLRHPYTCFSDRGGLQLHSYLQGLYL